MYRSRTRIPGQVTLACLGAALLFLTFSLILKPSSPPTAQELLNVALEELEKRPGYLLAIEEYSPGYRLSFEGAVQSLRDVKGKIIEYNLEVYRQGEDIDVRREGETEWQRVEKSQLGGLNSYITSPHEVLKALQEYFPLFTLDEGGEKGPVFHFESEPPDKSFVKHFFPKLSPASIDYLRLEVMMESLEGEAVIKQVIVVLAFKDSTYGDLTRVYTVD